jgi:hypothetical protein
MATGVNWWRNIARYVKQTKNLTALEISGVKLGFGTIYILRNKRDIQGNHVSFTGI